MTELDDFVAEVLPRLHHAETSLLERLFEVTDDGSRRGYTLEVRVSNEGAIKLYERLGFTGRGIRRGYYTDNREPGDGPETSAAGGR